MSRTIVIGDIHGGYLALMQLLERAKITIHDRLIFLGDYVDGWSESHKVVDKLLALEKTHQCIFLRGNHETLIEKWLKTKIVNDLWLNHGGNASVEAYKNLSEDDVTVHLAFFEGLKSYYVDDENRLFVHAGFTNPRGVKDEFFEEYLYWDRTLWETAMAIDPLLTITDKLYPRRFKQYKEIYIGHTPVTHFNFTTPVNFANVWNIDTGAAFLGKITALDIDTKEFWQSDCVYEFYPNEKGRN